MWMGETSPVMARNASIISGVTVTANGGSGSYRGGSGISSSDIELSGSLELTAKAGSPNGKALSQNGIELDPNTFKEKLDPGANIITKDADGKVLQTAKNAADGTVGFEAISYDKPGTYATASPRWTTVRRT